MIVFKKDFAFFIQLNLFTVGNIVCMEINEKYRISGSAAGK